VARDAAGGVGGVARSSVNRIGLLWPSHPRTMMAIAEQRDGLMRCLMNSPLSRAGVVVAAIALIAIVAGCAATDGRGTAGRPDPGTPELVTFRSGELVLKGLLWKPAGPGPFPAVIYNHGSGRMHDVHFALIGPMFAREGFVLFAPYRRGQGLSADQGTWVLDTLERVAREEGMIARGKKAVELLKTEQLNDLLAALARLQDMPFVDRGRIAVMGNSFGGVLTMVIAQRGGGIRAGVNMAGAALNWKRSPEFKQWMMDMARDAKVPVFFLQAENDMDTDPSREASAEMTRLGKPNRMKIYPPFGKTTEDGHSFGYLGSHLWGPDVIAFLRETMGR
jgi:carboxymethylenebutenolidase